ncbi:MAG TPA: type VI secretion system tube protein TssD [Candidatus Acidoferrales bacterium]|nr:type VI secretion system tube protein TssD [Candidatus Acidoferrales bacterium]
MRIKLAILLAALGAMCIGTFNTAQADKNKKNKNQASPQVTEDSAIAPASGPASFFVTIRGVKQGIFGGQSAGKQRTNEIRGSQFSLQLTAPRDNATGQASGRRQYAPVSFTKQWDASSPQIFQAAATGETLSLVQFDFVRTALDGRENVYETIKLTDAIISSVKDYIGYPQHGEQSDTHELEEVEITFQKIEVTYNDGKSTFMDDWNSPR